MAIKKPDKQHDIVTSILDKIESIPERPNQDHWDHCWRDMAEMLRNTATFDRSLLTPSFLKDHATVRWGGEWLENAATDFVTNHDEMIRRSVFGQWFKDCPRIVELGCGSGRNIALLSEMFPDAELVASDASFHSRDIVGHAAKALGKEFPWFRCDLRSGSGFDDLKIDHDTSVLTVHAMEQLGSNYVTLFDHFMTAKPAQIVNIEPLDDLYDQDVVFDKTAFLYHQKRGYLDGWLDFLKSQENLNRLVILQQTRFGLGDMYHEAYSLVVWKPL